MAGPGGAGWFAAVPSSPMGGYPVGDVWSHGRQPVDQPSSVFVPDAFALSTGALHSPTTGHYFGPRFGPATYLASPTSMQLAGQPGAFSADGRWYGPAASSAPTARALPVEHSGWHPAGPMAPIPVAHGPFSPTGYAIAPQAELVAWPHAALAAAASATPMGSPVGHRAAEAAVAFAPFPPTSPVSRPAIELAIPMWATETATREPVPVTPPPPASGAARGFWTRTPSVRVGVFDESEVPPTPRMLARYADSSAALDGFLEADDLAPAVEAFVAVLRHSGAGAPEREAGSAPVPRYDDVRARLLASSGPNDRLRRVYAALDARRASVPFAAGPLVGLRVLVLGAGPGGLLTAIEAALAGANVLVLEKRESFSRNNVLHIWPSLIALCRELGLKVLLPSFCTGNVNHVGIRVLQVQLVKIALCAGVRLMFGVDFLGLGGYDPMIQRWRIDISPPVPEVLRFDFEVIVGATGVNNALRGFAYRATSGPLALGITANFVRRRTPEETNLREVLGESAQFHQQKFASMAREGLALQNFVYYRDHTHYFVFTPAKATLLAHGVLLADAPRAELLARTNVDRAALVRFAQHAVVTGLRLLTGQEMPHTDYMQRANGSEDVDLFDFSETLEADHAARVEQRDGRRLLIAVVGDSMKTPFWPQGTGANRAALGAQDTVWAMIGFLTDPLRMLAARHQWFLKLKSVQEPREVAISAALDPRERYGAPPPLRGPVDHLFDVRD